MSSNHTPGPWRYDGQCFIWATVDGEEKMVAEIRGFGANLPQDANGELLAVAPELLEACKEAVLSFEWIGEREATNVIRSVLQKAIKKAEKREKK